MNWLRNASRIVRGELQPMFDFFRDSAGIVRAEVQQIPDYFGSREHPVSLDDVQVHILEEGEASGEGLDEGRLRYFFNVIAVAIPSAVVLAIVWRTTAGTISGWEWPAALTALGAASIIGGTWETLLSRVRARDNQFLRVITLAPLGLWLYNLTGSINPLVLLGGVIAAHPLKTWITSCLLYTSPSPRDATLSRMPSSA